MRYHAKLTLHFASPCDASWDAMEGDDTVRFCEDCKLHVYNLAEMTEDEALELFAQNEDRVCAAAYQREDGTVLTKDCPIGVEQGRVRYVLRQPTEPPDWGRR